MRSNARVPSRAPRPGATGGRRTTPWWPRLLDRLWSARETRILRSALRGTAALLFPVQCVCCRRPDASLCRPCATGLRRAGLHPGRVERHAEALPLNQRGQALPVVAAGKYEHELASVLLAYKNHQMVSLGKVLAPVLASALRAGILETGKPAGTGDPGSGPHAPAGTCQAGLLARGPAAAAGGGRTGRCRQTCGSRTC